MIKSSSTVAAAVAVAALTLAGCSSSGGTSATKTVTATITKAATVTKTVTVAPEQPASASAEGDDATADDSAGEDFGDGNSTRAFGSTAKFDGWSINVSAPAPYRPTADAMTTDDKKWPSYKVLTVVLKNTGHKPLDPSLSLMLQGNVDGNDADEVYDSPLPDSPTSKLMPGQSATWKVAYGVKADSKITVQVGEFMGDTTVIFE